jgi:hypothetical protein
VEAEHRANPSVDGWMTVNEAATQLRFSRSTVERLIDRGFFESQFFESPNGVPRLMIKPCRCGQSQANLIAGQSIAERTVAVIAGIAAIIGTVVAFKALYDSFLAGLSISPQSTLPSWITFNFSVLFFWAFVLAVAGGLPEILLFRGRFLGGTGKEPTGEHAYMWGSLSNAPLAAGLVAIGFAYQIGSVQKQATIGIFFLIGVTFASALVYNVRFRGVTSVREILKTTNTGYFVQEFWLATAWSASIAALGFGFAWVARSVWWPWTVTDYHLAVVFVVQVIAVWFLTTLAVMLCIGFLPYDQTYDPVRGVVAALALRGSLFLGLFVCAVA